MLYKSDIWYIVFYRSCVCSCSGKNYFENDMFCGFGMGFLGICFDIGIVYWYIYCDNGICICYWLDFGKY